MDKRLYEELTGRTLVRETSGDIEYVSSPRLAPYDPRWIVKVSSGYVVVWDEKKSETTL